MLFLINVDRIIRSLFGLGQFLNEFAVKGVGIRYVRTGISSGHQIRQYVTVNVVGIR